MHVTTRKISLPLDDQIEFSGLSERSSKALRRALQGNSPTRQSISRISQRDLRMLPRVGLITLNEIVDWAARQGIDLARE
jgi:hypothetical protein